MKTMNKGFTLIELIIAVAIIGILTMVAIPTYQGYLESSRKSTARVNLDSMRVFVEDYGLNNGNYGTASTTYSFTPGESGITDTNSIVTSYGWDPDGDENAFSYYLKISADSSSYDTWAKHVTSGDWVRCDDRNSNCCDGNGTVSNSCP